jgi:hypothetical protein
MSISVRSAVLTGALLISLTGGVFAQSVENSNWAISGGVAFPRVYRHVGPDVFEDDGQPRSPLTPEWRTARPAYWGDAIHWLSPRVSLQMGVEHSPSFDLRRGYRATSLSYRGEIQHRETTASVLVAVAFINGRRVGIRGTTGTGFVVGHTSELGTYTVNTGPNPQVRQTKHTKSTINLAFVGGVEIPVAVAGPVSIVPRARARFVWGKGWRQGVDSVADDVTKVFNRFALSSGLAVEVRF